MDSLTVSRWIADIPGMSNAANLATLYDCALRTRDVPGLMVEVGTWCGRSAVVLGRAAAEMRTRLECFDLFLTAQWWRNKVSAAVYASEIAPVYARGGPERLARNAIEAANLTPYVAINNLGAASFYIAAPIRFAFIDGGHDYRSVADDCGVVMRCVSPGAWIVFDDVFTGNYPDVPRAIADMVFRDPRLARVEKLNNKMMAIQVN